jgi:hypothetical protein
MTNAQTATLVFKDQAGEFYVLPMETLERGRVPAEHRAEVERLLAESDDVQGHAIPLFWAGFMVGNGATAAVALLVNPSMPAREWVKELYGADV